MILRALADVAFRLVFPQRCVLCGREDSMLCGPCRASLPAYLQADTLPKLDGIQSIRAVWPYEGRIREIVRNYKYSGLKALAPILSAEMAGVLEDWNPPVSMIVHIPSHHTRLRERGFDQAELLAREVAAATGIPFVAALTRIRETPIQARASNQMQRQENVRDAFAAQGRVSVRGMGVLLIDDVMTTGATLRDGARAIKDSGGGRVYGLTLAHET